MNCNNEKDIFSLLDESKITEVAEKKSSSGELKKQNDNVEADNGIPFDYKREILRNALEVSNKINKSMLEEEGKKSISRILVLIFLSLMLYVSIILISKMIYLNGLGTIKVDNSVIIASFTYVVANVLALMQILVKYISENKLLDTFETVTQTMLEFLVRDNTDHINNKAENNSNVKEEK